MVGPEFRGPLHHAGKHVQASPQTAEKAGSGGLAVLRHPKLLLGRAQADEDAIRPALPDILQNGAVFLEIAVPGSGDLQPRVSGRQPFPGGLRHPGLGPQEVERQSLRRHALHQPGGKLDAGDLFLQGRAQHSGPLHHADAVGEHQVRPVHRLPGGQIFPADLHNFRVGRHHVVGPGTVEQLHPPGHRLVHGDIVKSHAQHIDPHGITSFPFPAAPAYYYHFICIIA